MSYLTLTVTLGNDAMETAGEVIDSIRRALVADTQDLFEPLKPGEGGAIFDGNGNRVGGWVVQS